MKKLYRSGTIHPSPPIKPDHLSFLPASILVLATALSPDEREVLAYLISCSNANTSFPISHGCRRAGQKFASGKAGYDRPGLFNCDCFSCYTSFWARWDSSPNRHLIHEIIDAYENELAQNKGTRNNRKERRKKNNGSRKFKIAETAPWNSEVDSSGEAGSRDCDGGIGSGCGGEEESQKGSMRRLVSFIGEKVWGTWTQQN